MSNDNLYKWIPNDEFHHGMYDMKKHFLLWRYCPAESGGMLLREVCTTDTNYGSREKTHVMIIELYVKKGSDNADSG